VRQQGPCSQAGSNADQGGGLEHLPGRFPGKLLGGRIAQFVADQGQELAGGVRVAFADGVQDLGDLTHQG
jgi:hypothetical protein